MKMRYADAKIRAEVFKALGHPARLLMLQALAEGERSVADFQALTQINQSNISRHTAMLKRAGLIADRRDGMCVVYRLKAPKLDPVLGFAAGVMTTEISRRLATVKGDA